MLESLNFMGNWRDYQARVLEEMDEHFGDGRLHVVAAPGAGKTILGLEIVRRIARPALVFAPTIAIREQWAQRLCPLFLDTPPEGGAISRDLADFRELTLTSYQALDSLRCGDELNALIDDLNGHGPLTLVLDEAHHLRREWWKSLNELANRLVDDPWAATREPTVRHFEAIGRKNALALCGRARTSAPPSTESKPVRTVWNTP